MNEKIEEPKGLKHKDNMIRYMQNRIIRENQVKEEIEASGLLYYGILPIIEDQLARMEDETFWRGQPKPSQEEILAKRKKEWAKHVEDGDKMRALQAKVSKSTLSETPKIDKPLRNKPKKKAVEKPVSYEVKEDEIDELAERLHQAHITWAENLEDVDQRQGWLDFYKVSGAQDRTTGEYWKHKKEAVRHTWVLEMNGLLPHQNGIVPPKEERLRIWKENYGK